MPGPVERWLGTFMCKQYANTFEACGFKTLQSVCQLQLSQLQAMGVSRDHCGKVLENVKILRQTLSGNMNHYSDQYGNFDPGNGRMAAMGYAGRYDNAGMGNVSSASGYPPLAHGYSDQNNMMMHQQPQQPMTAHGGMYNQSQNYMMQQQPNSTNQYSPAYGISGAEGHSQMGNASFYGSAPQQQMPQTTPIHHHMRQVPSVNTSPQQVADNILHMASAYPQQQTVQVPLNNKNRQAPYHIQRSPHYNIQTSPGSHQIGMNMSRSPHYNMQSNSPNQSTMDSNHHVGYPSSPLHQQSRTSPVSPMLLHSPISQQSNHSHQSLPSPGSLHSPTSTGTVRSPVPSPGYHQGVGGLRSPTDMQQMAMSQQMRSLATSHMSSVGTPSRVSGSSGHSSSQQHYSTQSQQEAAYQPVPKGDMRCTLQSQIYHNPPTSSIPYVSESCSTSGQANACLANPLQSLQKLVTLPESHVVDPKSVVNDACLPSPQSHDSSKNCDSSAERLGEDYSGSAEYSDTTDQGQCTYGKSPRCLNGKNCSKGENQAENCNSKSSTTSEDYLCHHVEDDCILKHSGNSNVAEKKKTSETGNIKCNLSDSSLHSSSGSNEIVNGDFLSDNVAISLRNSARKHPKTRIKKLAKTVSENKNDGNDDDDDDLSSSDKTVSCSPAISTHSLADSETGNTDKHDYSRKTDECSEEFSIKNHNSSESKYNVKNDNKSEANSKCFPSESKHSDCTSSESTCQTGWGLFLKSTEDFNDFEHELSDNENCDPPVPKPFTSSPFKSDCSSVKKIDVTISKNSPLSRLTENPEQTECSSQDNRVQNKAKHLHSNDTGDAPNKKLKLEKPDNVRSLPPKKSPKGRLRRKSSSELLTVKDHFSLDHTKLNSCFVDLSSDLNPKIGKLHDSDNENNKKLRMSRKFQFKNCPENASQVETESEKRNKQEAGVSDTTCYNNSTEDEENKDNENKQNTDVKKPYQKNKQNNLNDVKGKNKQDGNDSDNCSLEIKNEIHISNQSKSLIGLDSKNNEPKRKLSPLRFVNSNISLSETAKNGRENQSKVSGTVCKNEKEDFVSTEGVKANEDNSADDVTLDIKIKNCLRNSAADKFDDNAEARVNNRHFDQKQCHSGSSISSIKNRHKSGNRRVKKKKSQKQRNVSYGDFEALKLTKSIDLISHKKKRIQSAGPFVRIEGNRKFPNIVKVFNQTPLEDKDSKSCRNQKTGFVSTPTIQVSNIPSDKSVMLSFNRILSEESWLCALCGKQTSHKSLGDLFGPYYLENHLALLKAEDESKKEASSQSKISPEPKSESCRTTRKRHSSSTSDIKPNPTQKPVEVWVHEDCVLWADGVFLIGSKIYGLEEAIKVAHTTVCSSCKENGAMVGCLYRGCGQKYHFVCAVEKGCLLDEERFTLFCPKHKVQQEKKIKSEASTSKS